MARTRSPVSVYRVILVISVRLVSLAEYLDNDIKQLFFFPFFVSRCTGKSICSIIKKTPFFFQVLSMSFLLCRKGPSEQSCQDLSDIFTKMESFLPIQNLHLVNIKSLPSTTPRYFPYFECRRHIKNEKQYSINLLMKNMKTSCLKEK